MLQPAASSLSLSAPATSGLVTTNLENGAPLQDFRAVLASNQVGEAQAGPLALAAELTAGSPVRGLAGKDSGNGTGKDLPDALPEGDAGADREMMASTKGAELSPEASAEPEGQPVQGEAPGPAASLAPVVVPAPVVPVSTASGAANVLDPSKTQAVAAATPSVTPAIRQPESTAAAQSPAPAAAPARSAMATRNAEPTSPDAGPDAARSILRRSLPAGDAASRSAAEPPIESVPAAALASPVLRQPAQAPSGDAAAGGMPASAGDSAAAADLPPQLAVRIELPLGARAPATAAQEPLHPETVSRLAPESETADEAAPPESIGTLPRLQARGANSRTEAGPMPLHYRSEGETPEAASETAQPRQASRETVVASRGVVPQVLVETTRGTVPGPAATLVVAPEPAAALPLASKMPAPQLLPPAAANPTAAQGRTAVAAPQPASEAPALPTGTAAKLPAGAPVAPESPRAAAETKDTAGAAELARETDAGGETRRPVAASDPAPRQVSQPIVAAQDLRPFVNGTPSTFSAPLTQAEPHDFAALVDRLVEAREAARPQSVQAAITHAAFGQVALNFDYDGSRLTVSMRSDDPGFAPAAQAAAATQSAASSDNGTPSQRQDSSGQQLAGQASGQPQTQAQAQSQSQGSGQGAERWRRDGGDQAFNGSNPKSRDEQRPGQRSGIYA